MICVAHQARRMQAGRECSGRRGLVLGLVKRASALMIVQMLAGSQLLFLCHDRASQELEYLRMCDGGPCWDLEALKLLTVDAEQEVDASGSECAWGGRNLVEDLQFQWNHIGAVASAYCFGQQEPEA